MSTPFPPEAVAQIKRHMNDDHTDDARLIVRGLGDRPDAVEVTTVDVDAEAIHFLADGERIRVPWGETLAERPQVRAAVVRLYQEACRRLGVAPHGEH